MFLQNGRHAKIAGINFKSDLFFKLSSSVKLSNFDELLGAIDGYMAELDDASFVAFYVYRANGSYEIVFRFKEPPTLSNDETTRKQLTEMNAAEKKELSKRQLYTLGKQGKPIIAHTAKTYPFDYYFKQRKTHSNGSINVLTAFNPAEYTMSVDFEVKNAIFVFDDTPVNREHFYVTDEWARDVRVSINNNAEAVYAAADEIPAIRAFRDYKPNDMLLVKNAGYVRRACLISCGEQAAEVLLVDYGSKLRCSISQLRVAPANIVAPRFLAIPCSLAGVAELKSHARTALKQLLEQLDRKSAKLVVAGKSAHSTLVVSIDYSEHDGAQLSAVNTLKRAGLLDDNSATADTTADKPTIIVAAPCAYERDELLALALAAQKLQLSADAAPIKCANAVPTEIDSRVKSIMQMMLQAN